MNKKVIGIVVGVVVLVVAVYFIQLQRQAAKWKEAKEIAEESITKEGDVTTLRFVSVVEGPLDRVQAALWGVERGAETIENIKRVEVVKEEGNTKVVKMDLRALNLPLQRYTMEFKLDPERHRIAFKTLESQTQMLDGAYTLEASPDGSKTSVVYVTEARQKVALPFPQGVLDSANREVFVNTMRGVAKTVGAPPAG
jgi:preprotein translocase subunit YajC